MSFFADEDSTPSKTQGLPVYKRPEVQQLWEELVKRPESQGSDLQISSQDEVLVGHVLHVGDHVVKSMRSLIGKIEQASPFDKNQPGQQAAIGTKTRDAALADRARATEKLDPIARKHNDIIAGYSQVGDTLNAFGNPVSNPPLDLPNHIRDDHFAHLADPKNTHVAITKAEHFQAADSLTHQEQLLCKFSFDLVQSTERAVSTHLKRWASFDEFPKRRGEAIAFGWANHSDVTSRKLVELAKKHRWPARLYLLVRAAILLQSASGFVDAALLNALYMSKPPTRARCYAQLIGIARAGDTIMWKLAAILMDHGYSIDLTSMGFRSFTAFQMAQAVPPKVLHVVLDFFKEHNLVLLSLSAIVHRILGDQKGTRRTQAQARWSNIAEQEKKIGNLEVETAHELTKLESLETELRELENQRQNVREEAAAKRVVLEQLRLANYALEQEAKLQRLLVPQGVIRPVPQLPLDTASDFNEQVDKAQRQMHATAGGQPYAAGQGRVEGGHHLGQR